MYAQAESVCACVCVCVHVCVCMCVCDKDVGKAGCELTDSFDSQPYTNQPTRWLAVIAEADPTPYPAIDSHVVRVASRGSRKRARIRRWTFFPSSKVVSYDIADARFCGRIGREHKSNGVYFVVNLQTGLLCQKCYDPDCRAAMYKSREEPLPLALLPFQHHVLQDEQQDSQCCITNPNHPATTTTTTNNNNNNNNGSGSVGDDGEEDDFLHAVDQVCAAAEEGILDVFLDEA